MEPTINKIRIATRYVTHPKTKQIYSFYQVVVKWPDGTRKVFDSEEDANAHIEGRKVDKQALQAEFPSGVEEAIKLNTKLIDSKPKDLDDIKEEQAEFDVVFLSYEGSKVPVIKAIRAITGKTLVESKNMIVNAPSLIVEKTFRENAEAIKRELEDVGGVVEIR